MNIPLREARELSDQDGPEAPRAAVISEAMARRYWPGENPLGRRISLGEPGPAHPWIRIVGVVGDIRQHLMERAAQPVLYLPYPQAPTPTLDFVLRTDAEPADSHGLAGTARAELQKLAADQTPYDVRTMRKLIDTWEAFGFRFSATLMTVFGGLALLLAAIGVYGVLSRAVRDQTRELGLRLALGADSFTVLMGVMKWGLKVVSLGLIIGLVMALLLVRAVSSMLYGVDPIDVVSFVVFPAILVVVAGFACYLPARRAARIDPMMALRDE
jgi:putative ABC transport system permease protein